MKLEIKHWIGIVIGILLAGLSVFIFRGSNIMYFGIVVSLLVTLIPFMISFLSNQRIQRGKEEQFLAFSRDLVETVRSGTPIAKGIINLRNRDYGPLSLHVKKLANQVFIGITLADALLIFAKDVNNPAVSRAVGLISEAEKAGGQIGTVLESVANSVGQIEKLKKERKAAVSNLITQGYMIFFVFIIIMLVLQYNILPLVSNLGTTNGLNITPTQHINANEFSMPLFVMLLVQSFFAGLVIGKISEGTIKSGIKHSFILLALTLLITTGAKALLR